MISLNELDAKLAALEDSDADVPLSDRSSESEAIMDHTLKYVQGPKNTTTSGICKLLKGYLSLQSLFSRKNYQENLLRESSPDLLL
jgi:hypothetical protein